MRRIALVLAGVALIASCGSATSTAGMGPLPVTVCGTYLGMSPGGTTYILTSRTTAHLETSPGQPIFVGRFVSKKPGTGCQHGARFAWTPSAAARLVKAAKADDGLDVVIAIAPTGSQSFTVTATAPGQQPAKASVTVSP